MVGPALPGTGLRAGWEATPRMSTVDGMTTIPLASAARERSQASRVLRQVGVDSGYLLLGLPVALAGFTVLINAFATGIRMLVMFLGLPTLVATVWAARGFAA